MMFRNPTSMLLVKILFTYDKSIFFSATTASSLGEDDLLGTTPQSDYDYEEPTPEPESGTSEIMISIILMIIELVFIF